MRSGAEASRRVHFRTHRSTTVQVVFSFLGHVKDAKATILATGR